MAEGGRSRLGRLIAWIVALPVLALAVLFALDNRGALALGFWPASFKLTLPVYLAIFGSVLAGFLMGALVAWFAGGRRRAALRRARHEVERLSAETEDLQRRLNAAESAQRAPASGAAAAKEQAQRQLVVANS